ncbi:hypothetical protein VCHENC03_3694 [Vibrio sp. HENC-03]|nr:hypothetical protein VCHENC03_3694 [Vibrio sp. HENC-03]
MVPPPTAVVTAKTSTVKTSVFFSLAAKTADKAKAAVPRTVMVSIKKTVVINMSTLSRQQNIGRIPGED